MTITPAQMAQARALVQSRLALQRDLAPLKSELDKARAQNRAINDYLRKRLDWRIKPDNIAGLAELYQRNPGHGGYIRMVYQNLLQDMLDPPALEPGLPKPRPRQIDFVALSPAARPYFLGPYLGLVVGNRFAELCLARSRPDEGRIVIVQTGGPIDVNLYKSKLPSINAWLYHRWIVADHDATSITLHRQKALPKVIPLDPATMLQRGELVLGIDTTSHRVASIPFDKLTAGTLLTGTTGSGKTNGLHVMLRSIFANAHLFARIIIADGKDGVGMARYRGLPKVEILIEPEEVWKAAADLRALMRTRNAAQLAAGVEKQTHDLVAFIIDELPTFVTPPSLKAERDSHAVFLDDLAHLARRGRSAGFRMIFVTQSPVKEEIPVPVRANCGTIIAFRLTEVSHATAVFGTLSSDNDPRQLPDGHARVLHADEGKVITIQAPLAPAFTPPQHALSAMPSVRSLLERKP